LHLRREPEAAEDIFALLGGLVRTDDEYELWHDIIHPLVDHGHEDEDEDEDDEHDLEAAAEE
jgi:hypothetical protein